MPVDRIKYIFILLATMILLSGYHPDGQRSFCDTYPEECESFNEFISTNEGLIDSIITGNFNLDKNFLIPVVAPEVAYYSSIQDKIETLTLEIFYTELGADYSNFSIGLFQMKPAFIEKLESEFILAGIFPEYSKYLQIDESDPKAKRKIRLTRLKKLEWQLNYLCLFQLLMEQKFRTRAFSSEQEKLLLYATAYNTDLDMTEEKFLKMKSIALFPSGKQGDQNNFIYGQVSCEFYQIINKNE